MRVVAFFHRLLFNDDGSFALWNNANELDSAHCSTSLPSSSWDIPVMCYDCWNLQLQFSMSFFQKLLVCWWLTSVLVVVEVTDIFSRFTVRHPILLTSVNETCSTVRLSLTKTALPYWSCGRSTTSLIQWLKWFCEAGDSPDEARLEQTPYPFQPH